MKLHVEEVGQENSETIVFLHEASLAGWMWKEQVKSFKDYHLIIPDLQNTGKVQISSHSPSKLLQGW